MIVVSDTSPLTDLLTFEAAEILRQLFLEIIIPEAVRDELAEAIPAFSLWLRVEMKDSSQAMQYARIVDEGEAQAITLARELRADWLLIDERKGRKLATREGISVYRLARCCAAGQKQPVDSFGTRVSPAFGGRGGDVFCRPSQRVRAQDRRRVILGPIHNRNATECRN